MARASIGVARPLAPTRGVARPLAPPHPSGFNVVAIAARLSSFSAFTVFRDSSPHTAPRCGGGLVVVAVAQCDEPGAQRGEYLHLHPPPLLGHRVLVPPPQRVGGAFGAHVQRDLLAVHKRQPRAGLPRDHRANKRVVHNELARVGVPRLHHGRVLLVQVFLCPVVGEAKVPATDGDEEEETDPRPRCGDGAGGGGGSVDDRGGGGGEAGGNANRVG